MTSTLAADTYVNIYISSFEYLSPCLYQTKQKKAIEINEIIL